MRNRLLILAAILALALPAMLVVIQGLALLKELAR